MSVYLVSDETAERLKSLRDRTGIATTMAVLDWCVRAMSEHYDRIDRANKADEQTAEPSAEGQEK